MTSLVAQFGWTGHVALAAGGLREHNRAKVQRSCVLSAAGIELVARVGPSHCAHVWRAGGGRVWWAPKIKSRASGGLLGKGRAAVGLKGGGPRRFGFAASFRTGPRRAGGRRSLLVVAECPGSLAASTPYGS